MHHKHPAPTISSTIYLEKLYNGLELFKVIIIHILEGVYDAVDIVKVFRILYRSSTILKLVLHCAFLNGVIFLGSLALDRWIITPFITKYNDVITSIFTSPVIIIKIIFCNILSCNNNNNNNIDNNINNNNIIQQPKSNDIEKYNSTEPNFYTSISLFYRVIFMLGWIIPIYSISFFANTKWYKQIASHVYDRVFTNSKKKDKTFTIDDPSPFSSPRNHSPTKMKRKKSGMMENYTANIEATAQELLRFILVSAYLLQTVVTSLLPIIGGPLTFFLVSWLNAFYAFEYKWSQRNIPIASRIRHFHKHWDYFLGFGFPHALCTYFWPYLISQGLYAIVFPLLIILGTIKRPPQYVPDSIQNGIPVFRFPLFVVQLLFG